MFLVASVASAVASGAPALPLQQSPSPPPPHRAYPADDAYLFYQFAAASYCPSVVDAKTWTCTPCQRSNQTVSSLKVLYSSSTDTRAFVAAYTDRTSGEKRIVVSFRGTETLLNWIYNLRIAKTDAQMSCTGCKVHSGFLDALNVVSKEMLDEVMRLRAVHPDAKLYFTGHSLGAALANLAAYILQYDHGVDVAGVYTMGSPRVGNKAFAAYYITQSATHVTWRLTHYRDPVPHLPLEVMGFRHVSTEVYYNENSTVFKQCDGSGEDSSCSNSHKTWWIPSVSDHLHYFDEAIGVAGCTATDENASSGQRSNTSAALLSSRDETARLADALRPLALADAALQDARASS